MRLATLHLQLPAFAVGLQSVLHTLLHAAACASIAVTIISTAHVGAHMRCIYVCTRLTLLCCVMSCSALMCPKSYQSLCAWTAVLKSVLLLTIKRYLLHCRNHIHVSIHTCCQCQLLYLVPSGTFNFFVDVRSVSS